MCPVPFGSVPLRSDTFRSDQFLSVPCRFFRQFSFRSDLLRSDLFRSIPIHVDCLDNTVINDLIKKHFLVFGIPKISIIEMVKTKCKLKLSSEQTLVIMFLKLLHIIKLWTLELIGSDFLLRKTIMVFDYILQFRSNYARALLAYCRF